MYLNVNAEATFALFPNYVCSLELFFSTEQGSNRQPLQFEEDSKKYNKTEYLSSTYDLIHFVNVEILITTAYSCRSTMGGRIYKLLPVSGS